MNSLKQNQENAALEAVELLKNLGIICIFVGGKIKTIPGWEVKKRKMSHDRMVVAGKEAIKEAQENGNILKSNNQEGSHHSGHLITVLFEGASIMVVPVTTSISQAKLYELSRDKNFSLRLVSKSSTKNIAIPEPAPQPTSNGHTGGTTIEENLAFQKKRAEEGRFLQPPKELPVVYGIIE